MTDYQREIAIGEQQLVRRGPRPPEGWVNRTPISLDEGQAAHLTGGSMPTRRRPRGHGGPTTPPPPPPPDPPPAPEISGIQGYARVWFLANGKSGGSASVDDIHTPASDATVYNVTSFSQLRTALLASGKRFIKVLGSALLDGGGSDDKVTNGAFTVDFSFYTGPGMKDYKLIVKAGDNIWTQGAMRPGEGSTSAKSADRRALSFNPGNDGTVIRGIALDHMSLAWGPDVVGSFINNVEDATVQYSLIGPALAKSNLDATAPGRGWNNTTPGNSDPSTIYTKRLTFYRNLSALNKQRNLKAEHTDGYDAVNDVVYDWGNQAPVHGNFRGGNIVNCIFKKGPETQASNAAFEADDGGAHPYDQYDDSTWHDGNIGITAAGGSFTPTWSDIDAAALRATPYDGGPTDAAHGPLTVDTADSDLFDDVVANAGRTFEDAIDAAVKAHVIAGTSDGYYNGAGFAAPHPSWPS